MTSQPSVTRPGLRPRRPGLIQKEHALAGHPKKRIPRAAQGERRSHLALKAQNLVPCPQCKSPKPPHQACPHCGTFRGRQVLKIKAKRAAA
jgi:large subunit ribosomal protein L32